MKNLLLAAIIIVVIFSCLKATAQQPDHDAMMKAWTAYMTPGEQHKMMAKTDGEWNTDITMWMEPNGQPQKSKGTCSNKMIMGGRYQESKYKGNFMGMPMEGMGLMAYDNAKKVFRSTWIDNMGTGVMVISGPWDEASKSINLEGTQTDPITGKDCKIREVLKFVDDKTHVMEMYMTPPGGGEEFKSMEIKFTKK